MVAGYCVGCIFSGLTRSSGGGSCIVFRLSLLLSSLRSDKLQMPLTCRPRRRGRLSLLFLYLIGQGFTLAETPAARGQQPTGHSLMAPPLNRSVKTLQVGSRAARSDISTSLIPGGWRDSSSRGPERI